MYNIVIQSMFTIFIGTIRFYWNNKTRRVVIGDVETQQTFSFWNMSKMQRVEFKLQTIVRLRQTSGTRTSGVVQG